MSKSDKIKEMTPLEKYLKELSQKHPLFQFDAHNIDLIIEGDSYANLYLNIDIQLHEFLHKPVNFPL